MEVQNILSILRHRWLIIAISFLSVTLLASLITMLTPRTYQATSQLYVSLESSDSSIQNLAQGSTFTQNQIVGFADLATSPLVLEPVVVSLGLNESAEALSAQVIGRAKLNTSLIDVVASADSSEDAALLSNEVARSMSRELPELQRPLDAAVSPVRITLTREATPPGTPASPNTLLNLAAGAVVGVALGVGIALLRATLDTRVRRSEDLEDFTSSPLLANIAYDPTTDAEPLALFADPLGPRSEAVRRVRTNLQFIGARGALKSFVVTSSLPGEGKSTVASNLALALVDAGSRVVLVDADLRKPTVAKVFGIEGGVGLTTLLVGDAVIDEVVQTVGNPGLDVIASGPLPPNPSELLGSRQMKDIVSKLENSYDIVIFDSAPLVPVTDGAVLSRLTGGALVVVSAESARVAEVKAALGSLEAVESRVLGLILNRVPLSAMSSHSYYGYGEGGARRKNRRTEGKRAVRAGRTS